MTTSRRNFIKTAGVAAGAVALPSALPSWISGVDAAEAAAAATVDKNALADIALSTARRLGVTYADIRINRYRTEAISTREKQVQNVSRSQNFGFGVRVLFKGTWGFASRQGGHAGRSAAHHAPGCGYRPCQFRLSAQTNYHGSSYENRGQVEECV